MNPALGKDIDRAIRKSRMTNGLVAEVVGVSESWVKQVRTGRIDRPPVAKLEKLADAVQGDLAKWLALSSQLVAASEPRERGADLAAVIKAIEAQTAMLERVLRALGGLPPDTIEEEVRELGQAQAEAEQEARPTPLRRPKGGPNGSPDG